MMQKLEPQPAGLKPTELGHVDRVTACDLTGLGNKPTTSCSDSDFFHHYANEPRAREHNHEIFRWKNSFDVGSMI